MHPDKSSAGRTITTLSSREVYRNHWMRVREDEILRANGEKGIFGVVEKHDGAIILPLDLDFDRVRQFEGWGETSIVNLRQAIAAATPPEQIAAAVLTAIRAEQYYILPQPEWLSRVVFSFLWVLF